jgi:hypothetical protein
MAEPILYAPALNAVIAIADSGLVGNATAPPGSGVYGASNDAKSWGSLGSTGTGVVGQSSNGSSGLIGSVDPVYSQPVGVFGASSNQGVMGMATTNTGTGVYGGGAAGNAAFNGIGVRGETFNGVAIQGKSYGSTGLAGNFIGNVAVSGNVQVGGDVILTNADCAEDFDGAEPTLEPGNVVVIDDNGAVQRCDADYDRKVAGVISGAGTFRPAIILDKRPTTDQPSPKNPRVPVALMGKVFCKVDADRSPISIGDLLTTSTTSGHAMKVADQARAFGAVIGKALARLERGRGLIPILIALQ